MAIDLSKPVAAMLYRVVSAEEAQYTKGDRVGETYFKAVLKPQRITAFNREEKHTILFSDEYCVEELPKYLTALEAGASLKAWEGLFDRIMANLQTVKLPAYQLGNPRKPGEFGSVKTSMNILIFLKEDLTLGEDPEDAARRVVERIGRWVTSDTPATAVAAPIDDLPSEEDEWQPMPGKEDTHEENVVTGEVRKKQ